MTDNPVAANARLHLERLKLAADVLLSESDDIPDQLEAELPCSVTGSSMPC